MKKNNYISFLYIIILVVSSINSIMSTKKLISVDFEVFGKVQGVFFRKYTQQQAQTLGLKGWCINTEKGSVQGNIQGDEVAIRNMKQWLKSTGSPSSRIDRSEFTNEKEINEYAFTDFKIRR